MRLIAALLVMGLVGCASSAVMRADYARAGTDSKQIRTDKDLCAREGLRTFWDIPASGAVAAHYMQKQFYKCMTDKGYEAIGVPTDIFKQTL